MYPFYGEILTGFFGDGNEWKEQKSSVFLFAESFTEAMQKIETYYGNEIIELSYLVSFEEEDIAEMSISVGRAMVKDAYQYNVGCGGDAQPPKEEKVIEIGPNDPLPEGLPYGTVVVQLYEEN